MDGLDWEWTCEFWLQIEGEWQGSTLIDLGQGFEPGFTVVLGEKGLFEVEDAYTGLKAEFDGHPAIECKACGEGGAITDGIIATK